VLLPGSCARCGPRPLVCERCGAWLARPALFGIPVQSSPLNTDPLSFLAGLGCNFLLLIPALEQQADFSIVLDSAAILILRSRSRRAYSSLLD
jgi:hypothetical protein